MNSMYVTIGNAITVNQPTQEVKDYCKSYLVVDNPDYYKKQRMGLWTGNTPEHLYLYERRGDSIIIPYGCRKWLRPLMQRNIDAAWYGAWTWEEYPDIDSFKVNYKSTIHTYDYQEEVVQAMLEAQNGIIVMPCGSGKTQTALETVARLGLRTLWLTHTQDLLHQSMERAKTCFECDSSLFGTITGGKVDIGTGITFATVQTMCKLDLNKYRTQWSAIIVDECQHCCGSPTKVTQFYKVVNSLYAPYKFGLTATPDRNDGLDRSMYALLGDKIIEISNERVADTTCPVKVVFIETGYSPKLDNVLNGDGTINYASLVKDLTYDAERFSAIDEVVSLRCKKYTIVLANRVQYLQDLKSVYELDGKRKAICLSTLGNSKKAKEERKEALRKLNTGEIDCIFATYQLAAEGLDCPNLRYIVFATPEKDRRTVMQAVGRVARKADGKEWGTVIDFVDSFGLFEGWRKQRIRYYRQMGCEV